MSGHGRDAGAVLLHPGVFVSIAVLLVNDHWLKASWSHPVTGKVSDLAGLVFFPLLLVGIVELGQWALRAYAGPSISTLILALPATACGFAAVHIIDPVTVAYEVALGTVREPLQAALAVQSGQPAWLPRVEATADVTDLWALPMLWLAWRIGAARLKSESGG